MNRLIPCLLLLDGQLVRSEQFIGHEVIGDPLADPDRFRDWPVDELLYLDIGRGDGAIAVLEAVARAVSRPVTFGGGIATLADMEARFEKGADKVAFNTAAFDTPDLVAHAAARFGRERVVISIDVVRRADGRAEVFVDGGRRSTGLEPKQWAREVEQLGAGEILLQSIDRDGTGKGYDTKLISSVSGAIGIPVIALGGAGTSDHLDAAITAGADAVAASDFFAVDELSR